VKKKSMSASLPKDLEKALERFPQVLVLNRKRLQKKRKTVAKFRELARKVHLEVQTTMRQRPSVKPEVAHRWRLCPPGQHWVSEHFVSGSSKRRAGHCASNPSGRDQLYPDEMHQMANTHFAGRSAGISSASRIGFPNGDQFDDLIWGWTVYWNEILKPETPLDPNLIKALVASESSFNPAAKALAGKGNFARGLLQVTDETRLILRDERGELKDHYVNISDKDAYNSNLNICAGVRWLFQKRLLASVRLKRQATWEEAVDEYKAFLSKRLRGQKYNKVPMEKFKQYAERLTQKRPL
jgi:hypothetical protein